MNALTADAFDIAAAHPADPHPVPVRAGGPGARARPRRPPRGAQERDRRRGVLRGPLPGAPVMPGVLLMESLAQAAGHLAAQRRRRPAPRWKSTWSGIDDAKFRRPVVPGDRLRLEVRLLHRRGALCRVRGEVKMRRAAGGRGAACCCRWRRCPAPEVDPTARVAAGAVLGPGRAASGPTAVIGPRVRLGAAHRPCESPRRHRRRHRAGRGNHVFPFASIGLAPQDLKYRGRADAAGDRRPQRVPRVRRPSTAAPRAGAA